MAADELLLRALSPELLPGALSFLDVESLLALEMVSAGIRGAMGDALETRCKHACFSTYLYPTMATYTSIAGAPPSWKLLYLRFSRLREMEWTACKSEGTSSTLRTLKSDNQEYTADLEGQFLLRSGGHYWFSVLQTPLADVTLSSPHVSAVGGTSQAELDEKLDKQKALAFIRAPLSINVGKWTKLRAEGAPCPRRHHSMTCLPTVMCPLHVLQPTGTDREHSSMVPVRRVLFFGGQAEGIPFEAFNDLHILLIDGRNQRSSGSDKPLARWIRLDASGQPPSRRCGHNATLLSNELLLISGGSDGTTPYQSLDVFLLHLEPDLAYGQFRWSTPRSESLPPGRGMHSVYRIASDEVLIFGGRQIRQSNGLLDLHRLKIKNGQGEDDDGVDASPRAVWTIPDISGAVPAPRRGHSTITVGEKLVLIGGQDGDTDQLHCDVRVLDVPRLQWRLPRVVAETPPCPRRGFKTQFFGTSLVISSGFVLNPTSSKFDLQLPDADIHALAFR